MQRGGTRRRTAFGLSLRRTCAFLLLVACGIGAAYVTVPAAVGPAEASHAYDTYGVGVTVESLVDHSRSTPPHDGQPGLPSRTLVTSIWYPAVEGSATSPEVDATPDVANGPYPLIVFSHGLGTVPRDYESLLRAWAAAGFVVAAPKFPLTSLGTPGGVDPADVYNQPGDVSFVISVLLLDSMTHTGLLSDMISQNEVGVAGHSEGAITTLGFFNTCCRDPRIKAAAVFSGDPEAYPGGHYVFDGQPPMLVVHGTKDGFLPYGQMVSVFNQQKGPKVLLSLLGANHGNWVHPRSKWFPSVVHTSIDFFRRYLEQSEAAGARIADDAQPGVTTVHYAPQPGQALVVTPPPTPPTHRHASLTPSKGLTDGQTVVVHWMGYLPGNVVNVVECSGSSESDCDFATGRILIPDAIGSGSTTLRVVEGQVGAGVCGTSGTRCSVYVNDAGLTSPAATIRIPISFTGGPAP
jgi:dienelactone hydrolase